MNISHVHISFFFHIILFIQSVFFCAYAKHALFYYTLSIRTEFVAILASFVFLFGCFTSAASIDSSGKTLYSSSCMGNYVVFHFVDCLNNDMLDCRYERNKQKATSVNKQFLCIWPILLRLALSRVVVFFVLFRLLLRYGAAQVGSECMKRLLSWSTYTHSRVRGVEYELLFHFSN